MNKHYKVLAVSMLAAAVGGCAVTSQPSQGLSAKAPTTAPSPASKTPVSFRHVNRSLKNSTAKTMMNAVESWLKIAARAAVRVHGEDVGMALVERRARRVVVRGVGVPQRHRAARALERRAFGAARLDAALHDRSGSDRRADLAGDEAFAQPPLGPSDNDRAGGEAVARRRRDGRLSGPPARRHHAAARRTAADKNRAGRVGRLPPPRFKFPSAKITATITSPSWNFFAKIWDTTVY